MDIADSALRRTELLLGPEAMGRLARARVIIFGVGGVGSWCAESLVRSGVRDITLVDSDRVCVTNVNRQLMATLQTVGQVKVCALRDRLLTINPRARVTPVQKIYTAETADDFDLDAYDFVVDAIDSLKDKALLILRACRSKARFISSMGAALKMDASQIRMVEFWDAKGCPLARALRKKFKRDGVRPARKFKCVFSPELLANKGRETSCGTDKCVCPKGEHGPGDPSLVNHEWCSSKAQINGTVAHVTAIFGLMIAGEILRQLADDEKPAALVADNDEKSGQQNNG